MLQQRWNEATTRERLLVMLMAMVAGCAVLITLLILPAWRMVNTAPATLQLLDSKVRLMREQAAYLRAAPAVKSRITLASPSAERELTGPGATVTEKRGDGSSPVPAATITMNGVESTRLAAWLAKPEVQTQLQHLNFSRIPTTGRVNGTAVLRTSP